MRVARLACLICLLAGVLGAGFVGARTVSATTGNTTTTPVPALYKVPRAVATLYPGQYQLKASASGARLSRGQMVIDLNPIGYLQGVASFFGYDAQGYQTSWVATLYNFRVIGPNKMSVQILDPLGTTVLGKMFWQRTAQGDLVGRIMLSKTAYSIRFHRNLKL
jgi:hypothetical protein